MRVRVLMSVQYGQLRNSYFCTIFSIFTGIVFSSCSVSVSNGWNQSNATEERVEPSDPTRIQPGSIEFRDDFYAGSAKCKQCHGEIYNKWLSTSHANQFASHSDPDPPHSGYCKRCHYTGDRENCADDVRRVMAPLERMLCGRSPRLNPTVWSARYSGNASVVIPGLSALISILSLQ